MSKCAIFGKPGWVNGTSHTTNSPTDQLVIFNLTIYRTLNLRIMIIFNVFKVTNGKGEKKLLQIPKINYCDFRRSSNSVPILSDLIKFAETFGNIFFKCPAQPGFYYVKDVPVSAIPIWILMPTGNYHISVRLIDENDVKKPVNFYKADAFFERN
jgi:hypothetical protein